MRPTGGIEPSGSAGERSRALRRRGLHDGRDFGRCSPRAGGAFAFSLAFCSIFGYSLVELTSASVDDGSLGGAGGGGTQVGGGRVGRVGPGWARRGRLGGRTGWGGASASGRGLRGRGSILRQVGREGGQAM